MIGTIIANLKRKFRYGNGGIKLVIREDGSGHVETIDPYDIVYTFDTLIELISAFGKE